MASIATDARPAFVGALLLTFALVPWEHRGHQRNVVPLDHVLRPPVVVPMELAGPPVTSHVLGPRAWILGPGIIEPADHPDAQGWPHGMVIRPPAFPDSMAIAAPTGLDMLLSALLGRWLPAAS